MSGTPMLIDPASVERIEVIKGPNSVLYGSDAIGGVINIITKKNADKPFTADIAAGYDGSGDAWRESAGVSGKVSGVGYRLGVANVEAGNLRVPHKVIEGTSYRQKSFDGLLSYDFSDKVTLGVMVSILIQTLTPPQRTPEAMMTLGLRYLYGSVAK